MVCFCHFRVPKRHFGIENAGRRTGDFAASRTHLRAYVDGHRYETRRKYRPKIDRVRHKIDRPRHKIDRVRHSHDTWRHFHDTTEFRLTSDRLRFFDFWQSYGSPSQNGRNAHDVRGEFHPQNPRRKDRMTMLPALLNPEIIEHLGKIRRLHEKILHPVSAPFTFQMHTFGREALVPCSRGFGQPRIHSRSPSLWHRPTRDEPQLRDAFTGSGLRHPYRARIARPRKREYDDDLHSRAEQGRTRREKPAGFLMRAQVPLVG